MNSSVALMAHSGFRAVCSGLEHVACVLNVLCCLVTSCRTRNWWCFYDHQSASVDKQSATGPRWQCTDIRFVKQSACYSGDPAMIQYSTCIYTLWTIKTCHFILGH